MRLVSMEDAWGQYSAIADTGEPPPEGIFIFDDANMLVAGCSIYPAGERAMIVNRVVLSTADCGAFLFRVLRAHATVTVRTALVQMNEATAAMLPLERSQFYELTEEEVPQARKKETDPGDSQHAEPTDQGGTGEDVPPGVVESKPRARRKKAKK